MAPIKTAILSFGMSGKLFHAPFLSAHPGFQLMGAWERTKKLIQETYPEAISYPTLESILEDSSIELVVVNTPNNTHFDYAKKVLLAGKHAIVEKAFTTNVPEAIELKVLAEKTGKKISVYQNRRYDSDFRTVKKIIQSEILGNLVEAEFHFGRYKPLIGVKLHKETPGPGAGLLNDLGPHLIDEALSLFGMPPALYGDIRITREHSLVDDWFDIVLHYPLLRVRLKSSMLARESSTGYILHGSKGSFIKSRADVQEAGLLVGKIPNSEGWGIEPESENGLLHAERDGVEIKEKVKTEQGNYYDYFDQVYKAISNDTAMPVTADDGINVMRILEAVMKSNEEKRVVDL
jgi:scyllo-inositol 2-dehydrogenase (NADP+)